MNKPWVSAMNPGGKNASDGIVINAYSVAPERPPADARALRNALKKPIPENSLDTGKST